MMKNSFSYLCLVLTLLVLAGCSGDNAQVEEALDKNRQALLQSEAMKNAGGDLLVEYRQLRDFRNLKEVRYLQTVVFDRVNGGLGLMDAKERQTYLQSMADLWARQVVNDPVLAGLRTLKINLVREETEFLFTRREVDETAFFRIGTDGKARLLQRLDRQAAIQKAAQDIPRPGIFD